MSYFMLTLFPSYFYHEKLLYVQLDIAHLQNTITTLEKTHDHQLLQVQTQLLDTTKELNATTLEISTIGLYVDKLEDRLANFAMSKREFIQEKEDTRNEVITILEGVEEERAKWESEKNLLLKEVENWEELVREKEKKLEEIEEKLMILEEEKEEMIKTRNKIEDSNNDDTGFTSTRDDKIYEDNDIVTNDDEEINPSELLNDEKTEGEIDASVNQITPANAKIESSINNNAMDVWEESEHEKENNLWDDSSYDDPDEDILSQVENESHIIQKISENVNSSNIPVKFPASELPQNEIHTSHHHITPKDDTLSLESAIQGGQANDGDRKDDKNLTNQIMNQNNPHVTTAPVLRSQPPPLRSLRKAFSRITGMHGTFTPHYEERKRKREIMEMMRRKQMIMNGERLRSDGPPQTP